MCGGCRKSEKRGANLSIDALKITEYDWIFRESRMKLNYKPAPSKKTTKTTKIVTAVVFVLIGLMWLSYADGSTDADDRDLCKATGTNCFWLEESYQRRK